MGRPSESRTIAPPGGSGVAAVMPASSSARPLASAMCMSSRPTNTGVRGVRGSIQSRRGNAPPHRSWSQPPPSTHASGRSVARAAISRVNSAGVAASRSDTRESPRPPARKCVWLSMNPGTTRRPASATRTVRRPARRSISASDPTATTRPCAMAMAVGARRPRSGVPRQAQIKPPVSTRSAGDLGAPALACAVIDTHPSREGLGASWARSLMVIRKSK